MASLAVFGCIASTYQIYAVPGWVGAVYASINCISNLLLGGYRSCKMLSRALCMILLVCFELEAWGDQLAVKWTVDLDSLVAQVSIFLLEIGR